MRDPSPGQGAELVGAAFSKSKGCRFNSRSEYIPRLGVLFLVGDMRGSIKVSLFLSLSSPFCSL